MRDVIVIGAGGGGPVVAKELAARGLDVLLLEAGPHHEDAESEHSHFENDQNNSSFGTLRVGPADPSQPPWYRELSQNSFIQQISGVGGTTLHYYGNSPRAMPGAFIGYQGPNPGDHDTAHLFPFPYQDLIPYYEWVEHTLPVETAAMGRKERAFLEAAARLGLPAQTGKDITQPAHRPQENAILQPSGTAGKADDPDRVTYPKAKGCTFCGHCLQSCILPRGAPRNLKAKRSTDNSYVPMALTADQWTGGRAVTLLSDAFAVSVDTDQNGASRGVTWRVGSTGQIVSEDAHVVVMSCGAIETPRLWLNSGLPDTNGRVGRGLTDHFIDMVVGLLPSSIGASFGPSSAARIDFPGRGMIENSIMTPVFAAQMLSLSDAGYAGYYDNGFAGGPEGADGMGRLPGNALTAALANLDRLMATLVFVDDDVEAQNRVRLSANLPPDHHGPVAAIDVRHRNRSARTTSNREFLVAQAVQLIREAGATWVHRMSWPPVLLHMQSSMRMGLSPTDSVLDDAAEARAVPRLFVADGSALANAIGGPNPALTIQAIATRTAERIFQRHFGGDPWVATEAPMSSIDPQVTNAVMTL
jgi:choline dehydrogenase-like flavoprotein